MANHEKPTQEELEEQIRKSQEEIDKLDSEEITLDDSNTEEEVIEDDSIPVDEVDEQEIEDNTEEDTTDYSDKSQDDIDLKDKLEKTEEKRVALSRESQRLYHQNTRVTEAIEEASNLVITPEELEVEAKKKGFDIADMSDVEKGLFETAILNEKRLAKITEANKVVHQIKVWNDKVDEYIEDPEVIKNNPILDGKQQQFTEFALQKENHGASFELLTSAFLYKLQKEATTNNKGKMFETGKAGPNEKPKPKSDKISVAESRILAKTNYKLYQKYVSEGKIDYGSID